MNGKCKLEEGCKVVAIENGEMFDMNDVECGMTFMYRGESPKGVHQFGPDYERYGRQGGLIGFQIPDDDMDKFFDVFRVLAPDNLDEQRG